MVEKNTSINMEKKLTEHGKKQLIDSLVNFVSALTFNKIKPSYYSRKKLQLATNDLKNKLNAIKIVLEE